MSQLIEKLVRLSQGTTQPIGFRPRQPAPPRARIQLVASLAQESVESLAKHIAGADAALVTIFNPSSGSETLKHVSEKVANIPWGIRLKTTSRTDIKPLIEAGADFIVFPAETPLATLGKEKTGKILEIEPSLSEGLLRVLNGLPIDAIFCPAEEKEDYLLTWQHLMLFQRLSGSLTKPLLVPVPTKITANELQSIWDAGVDGVVVEVTEGLSAGRFKELRQIIDGLTFPSPRQRGKPEPLVPHVTLEARAEEEEEEEEE